MLAHGTEDGFYFSAESWRTVSSSSDSASVASEVEFGDAFDPLPRALVDERMFEVGFSNYPRLSEGGNVLPGSEQDRSNTLCNHNGTVVVAQDGRLMYSPHRQERAMVPYLVILDYLPGDVRRNAAAIRLANAEHIMRGGALSVVQPLASDAPGSEEAELAVLAGVVARHSEVFLFAAVMALTSLVVAARFVFVRRPADAMRKVKYESLKMRRYLEVRDAFLENDELLRLIAGPRVSR